MARILIVDDDPSSVLFLGRLIAGDGHEVESFQTGREAIARGPQFRPHLLITDWLLKDQMDGAAVISELRQSCGALPAIVISGLPREHLAETTRALGNTLIVEKPVELSSLMAHLTRIVAAVGTPTSMGV